MNPMEVQDRVCRVRAIQNPVSAFRTRCLRIRAEDADWARERADPAAANRKSEQVIA